MAWMGVMLGRAPRAADEATSPEGVPLMYVVEGGPAADAGLRARDRVVTVNGVPVSSSGDLLEQLRRESPGNWVQLTVERGEEELDLFARAWQDVQALEQRGAAEQEQIAAITGAGLSLKRYNRIATLVDEYQSLENQVAARLGR